MGRTSLGILVLVLLLGGAAFCATKPFEKVTTQLDNATTFPRGARNIGMGATGVSDISGYSSGYFNPASFAWSDAVTLGASANDFLDYRKIFDARLSASYPLKRTAGGADLRLGGSLAYSTESREIKCSTTIYLPEGTRCIVEHPDRSYLGSLAVRAKKGVWELGLGGTAKYLKVRSPLEYTTWGFDLGLIAAADIEQANGLRMRPRIGARVRNLGPGIEFSFQDSTQSEIDQPGEFRYGGGIDVFAPPLAAVTEKLHRPVSAIGVSIDYDITNGNGSNHQDGWAFGTELSFFELLSLRAGRSDDVFYGLDCTTYGIGLGWDFGRALVQLDYARIDASCPGCEFLGIEPDGDAFDVTIGGRF